MPDVKKIQSRLRKALDREALEAKLDKQAEGWGTFGYKEQRLREAQKERDQLRFQMGQLKREHEAYREEWAALAVALEQDAAAWRALAEGAQVESPVALARFVLDDTF